MLSIKKAATNTVLGQRDVWSCDNIGIAAAHARIVLIAET